MFSSTKASTLAAVLKEDLPKPAGSKTSTGPAKGTARISMKAAAIISMFVIRLSKSSKSKKSSHAVSEPPDYHLCFPATTRGPAGGRIYKHSCHTCNVHFLTIKGFEEHILKSPAHKPFKLNKNVAKELGYLDVLEDPTIENLGCDNLGRPNTSESTAFRIFRQRLLRTSGPGPCRKLNCACPRFEFTPSQHIVADSAVGFESFTLLDGAAGSTLYGHAPDGDDDPRNVTLSFERPLLTIDPDSVPDNDELYMPPPDSDDEVARPPTTPKNDRTRAQQDHFEMRKRFAKGKNRKAAQKLRKEERFATSQAYVKPVIEAYVATDERLFGQKRFEEIDDETRANAKKSQQEAVENWQQEVGLLGTYVADERKAADQLAEDIDCFIQDVLFELDMQAEEEKRNKASGRYKKRLFFEDTIEDIAIDHEFHLADRDREKLRQDIGKKQTKKLREIKMEDIVDDIAMDHNQEVGEMEEENRRKKVGRAQNRSLTNTRMGDMVDDLTMDHVQKVSETEQEQYRKTVGKAQDWRLANANMSSHVDDLVIDHIHEVGEKEQERHRISFGMKQTKKLTSGKEVNLINSLTIDHLQEADKKTQEHHRKTLQMNQTEQSSAIKDANLVNPLVMGHIQDAGKMGEHPGDPTRGYQRSDLEAYSMGNAASNLAMERHQEQQKRATHCLEKGFLTGEAVNPKERSPTTTKGKPNTFPKKHPAIEETGKDINTKDSCERNWFNSEEGEVSHERAGKVMQGNLAVPKMSLDPVEVNANHGTAKSTYGIPRIKPEGKVKYIVSIIEAEAENNNCSDNDDGYSSPAPAPKKDRRQLRKEANAKFEAMMEQMVKAQEEQNRV